MTQARGLKKLIVDGTVDFGKFSADYSQHRPGFPDSFFERLGSVITSLHRGKVLDIGCGPGTVTFGLLQEKILKKPDEVIGVDVSGNQIEEAQKKAQQLGLSKIARFEIASAENTKQNNGYFDVAIAGQAWPWFQHDAAMKEIRRVLKPDGHFVIGQYCYLPRHSKVAADTEQLILNYNPTWTMSDFDGLYPQQVDQLVLGGGFQLVEQFVYDQPRQFSHEAWRGRIRTCNGVGSGIMTPEQISDFDNELKLMLKEKYPEEPLSIPHRIWAVIVKNCM